MKPKTMMLLMAITGLIFGYMVGVGDFGLRMALVSIIFIIVEVFLSKRNNSQPSSLIMSIFSPVIIGIFLSSGIIPPSMTNQNEGISCNEQ